MCEPPPTLAPLAGRDSSLSFTSERLLRSRQARLDVRALGVAEDRRKLVDVVESTTKRGAPSSVADSFPTIEAADLETITECNQKAELLLGWTKKELVGRKISELLIA